ncbi:hypothetical protein [Salegentibacter salarius]|uniref:Uncharacterized protein n=1 Tax=Salegentibacter salarius TaxID=435906 RepID=A0A2N0U5D0_9FLAO|nr:hypothetical protein [Salegentibacter salarius]OEY74002.1 hypothetical protein BHS39_00825 [Salegentibacter salarius]PKD22202.1 hypothetical protein APR40_00825 [Salegentibacter salarius]SLJ86222.1 hypothetical protein SAMN05660445_00088 [Salegentibacter salarius]
MKFRLLFISLFLLIITPVSAQEYWDMADFEISNYSIDPAWSDLSFGQQFFKGSFDLPSGDFLNVDENKRTTVDMVGILEQQRNMKKRTVDIGTPLPTTTQAFEISNNYRIRDNDEVYNDALNSNPYYQNQRIYQNALHRQTQRRMYYGSSYYVPRGNYY